MKTINKILFPTDFSNPANNAFRYALWFADKYGASIDLLHVMYPETEPLDVPVVVANATKERFEAAKEVMKIMTENTLTQVQAAHDLKQIPEVFSDVKVGTAGSVIANTARQKKSDLIIMGTHGEHNILEKTFGSVTTATIRNAPCAVLAIPDNTKLENIKSVAYATNLEESDPWHIWQMCKLLDPFGFILRVVHVERESDKGKSMSMGDLESFFKEHSPAIQITFHNIAGKKVTDELDNFADTWDIDLMVMYKPERGFFEQIFHKSVTAKEVHRTKVPLLILKKE